MSPFKTSQEKSVHLQTYVIIALLPAIVWSTFVFGTKTLLLLIASIAVSIATELSIYKLNNKMKTVIPTNSILSGMLGALILPVSVPIWTAMLSGFIVSWIMNISIKLNMGYNIINPVAASSLILSSFFSFVNHGYTPPFEKFNAFQSTNNVTFVNSVLDTFQNGTDSITNSTILNTFLGRESGNMGEVSILLLTVSLVFLLYKKYISYHIPVAFISTVFLISFFLPVGNCEAIYCAAAEVFSGGVVFAAVFVASLPTASPITDFGKIIFGIGCGFVTMILRRYLSVPDGSMFAVSFMSCFSYIFDLFCGNKYFSYMFDRKKNKEPKKTDLDALLKE